MSATIMQKAITPQLSDGYFNGWIERMAGYVIPLDAAAGLQRITDLIAVHGLDFPATPFSGDMPYLDVLRFEAAPELFITPAMGGTDERTAALLGAMWIDHEPFTGTGFVPNDLDRTVPLSWMPSHRIPYGAEIWRYDGSGPSTFVARYAGVHIGWVYRDDLQARRTLRGRMISRYSGGIATVDGERYIGDILEETHVAIVRPDPAAEEDGFVQTSPGAWGKVVPIEDVSEFCELDIRIRWNGLDLRVSDEVPTGPGEIGLAATSLQHDSRLNEGLELTKLDADWYEATLPLDVLSGAEVRQTQRPGWPGA
ncbi:MAG: hypothetical protein AAGC90_07850 [Curtobacterium sp.]|uniref:hypothetical protein n=1 Tax=Curtobacterium sp. Curtsp57 TaxID=3243047 RepID=UPI0031A8795E